MPDQEKNAEYKRIAEAALFVSGRAMGPDEIAAVLGVASVGFVKKMMDDFVEEYNARSSPLMISKLGDKYTLGVKEQYVGKVNQLAGTPDISKSSLRILAFISKNEPVMQNQIVKAFGTSAYDHIHELLEKEFIARKPVGRTKKVETTQKFREYFNV